MLKLYNIILYFYIIALNHLKTYGIKDYCAPTFCYNTKEHVFCKFQLEGPAKHCVNYERTIKSAADKQLILNKINSRRNKVAAGEIRSLGAAGNMMTMVWNEELATSAQRWGDQCVTQSVRQIEYNCQDLHNASVGQNVATIYDDAPGLTLTMLVDLWYIELLNVNSSVITNFQRSSITGSDHYEYFTQLIWAETSQVGCGAVKFKEQMEAMEGNKSRKVYRLVCNFAPAGNIIGKSVFSGGSPCSRCPGRTRCDTHHKALCAHYDTNDMKTSINSIVRSKYYINTESIRANLNNDSKIFTKDLSWPSHKTDYDENISFDFFTDLFEMTTKSSTSNIINTTICKEVLIVDELFDLLKKKLTNDQTLRELLLITNKFPQSGYTEETFTDPSVAEILNHIYTTKESRPTTKANNDYLNSTLLVDLVEAVIFRNNDKYSTSAIIDSNNQSVTEVNAVKIRAELGETKSNSDFTGHYFFPEEIIDETSSDKQTDNYYDMTDFSTSDVAIKIEHLRRNKGTKDFLEEILYSDFVTETVSQYMNNNNSGSEGNSEGNKYRCDTPKIRVRFDKQKLKRIVRKRRSSDESFKNYKGVLSVRKRRRLLTSFMNYNDLLRQLAADLKWLKLSSIFHCSQYNSVQKTYSTITLLMMTALLLIELN